MWTELTAGMRNPNKIIINTQTTAILEPQTKHELDNFTQYATTAFLASTSLNS